MDLKVYHSSLMSSLALVWINKKIGWLGNHFIINWSINPQVNLFIYLSRVLTSS